jgi:hypothetical protein
MNCVPYISELFIKMSLGKHCVHYDVHGLKRLASGRLVLFEVVEAISVKMNVSLDVTPYSLVERYLRNVGAYIQNYTASHSRT